MQDELLTRDNTHLSEPTSDLQRAPAGEVSSANCGNLVGAFIAGSISDASRRAYRTDLEHFAAWGGGIPASPNLVAGYLAAHAQSLSPATLVRRLAAISKAHRIAGLVSPVESEIVRATLRGIKRARGTAQRQAAPLLRDDLGFVIERMDDSLRATRDRALLLIGFAAALRRAELVALSVTDIEYVRQGIVLHLRRSKTDQEGRGEKIGVPFGRTRWCPVGALTAWLSRAGIAEGAIFRPVDRHGHVQTARLSAEAISSVVKRRVAAAGFDPAAYSGHSLRAGLVTSAAQAGIASWKIRQQTRHASDVMLARYIRDGELFTDNAVGRLL